MYIGINNRKTTRPYMLTSGEIPKPYIVVQNVNSSTTERGTLPLTTNTTSGLHLSVQLGGSYTASESYLTTNEDGSGLSETTALTRESTSGYLTRESTSGYLTRSSTSGYGINTCTSINGSGANPEYTAWTYTFTANVSNIIRDISYGPIGYSYRGGFQFGAGIQFGTYKNVNTYTYTITNAAGNQLAFVVCNLYSSSKLNYVTTATLTRSSTYSTLTRESTYSTLTRESTSAYSGKSSSSTIIDNRQTYRPLEGHSVSASDTYYTSYEQSEGLSSTTVLTRESTSGESYLTRSSTSGYGTKTVKTKPTVQSGYRMTGSLANGITCYCTRTSSYSQIDYTIGGQVRDYYYGTTMWGNSGWSPIAYSAYGSANYGITVYPYDPAPVGITTGNVYVATATVYTITETITTATLTRSSTSGTSYLTCSSTSGYSGVSSSSSSSAEWN